TLVRAVQACTPCYSTLCNIAAELMHPRWRGVFHYGNTGDLRKLHFSRRGWKVMLEQIPLLPNLPPGPQALDHAEQRSCAESLAMQAPNERNPFSLKDCAEWNTGATTARAWRHWRADACTCASARDAWQSWPRCSVTGRRPGQSGSAIRAGLLMAPRR